MEIDMMKPNWTFLILLPFIICSRDATVAPPFQPSSVKLTILHTNDLHSRLNGYSPESAYTPLSVNDDHTIGGFARIAAILEREREQAGGHVLTLDAGDFLMGTLFAALEPSTGFQLSLMQEMGYDAVAIGNHEFDFGPDYLSLIINRSLQRSDIPPLLLSNIAFDPENPLDDSLELLYKKDVIKPYQIVDIDSIRIGLLGLMGDDAIAVAPAMRPVKGLKPVKTCRKYVKQLRRNEKVDMVILVSHTGLIKNEKGEWTGDDVNLANKVKGIDLIISGHSHTKLEEPLYVNGVPIIQAKSYGAYVGKLELSVNRHQLQVDHYELIPVDDAQTGNKKVQSLISQQQSLLEQRILSGIGLDYTTPVVETDFPLILDEDTLLWESNLGVFIADALYEHLNGISDVRTDITIYPAGMIRDNITTGKQTVADLFRVVSLGKGNDEIPGYPLARIYVNGKELKGILEILFLSSRSSPGNHCYFGGLNVEYDPDARFLNKVRKAEVMNEEGKLISVDFNKKDTTLYSIVGNSHLLEFLPYFRKLSHGLVRVQPKYRDGSPVTDINLTWIDADPGTPGTEEMKTWISLIEYIRTFKDRDGNGIPEIPVRYSLN